MGSMMYAWSVGMDWLLHREASTTPRMIERSAPALPVIFPYWRKLLVNPLLAMPPFRYHFYEVTTDEEVTFILVSRREIVNTREPVEVQQISRYMFLEV